MKKVPIPKEVHFRHGDAYLLEAHAAIEFYIEEVCRRGLHVSVQQYIHTGRKTSVLQSLLDCYSWHLVASYPNQGGPFLSGTDHLYSACNWYIKNRVDKNNGVKKKDFIALFSPLGFDETEFDDILLDNLSTFGAERGDAAHGKLLSNSTPSATRLSNGKSLEIWTPRMTQSRAAVVPWEVDVKVDQSLPGLLDWDKKMVQKCEL